MVTEHQLLLSKSRFMSGLQCLRKLYLSCYRPELGTPPGAALQAVFDTGAAVGEIARDLRSGGTLIEDPYYLHEEAVDHTRKLLSDKSVPAIYEAAFTERGIRIRADILARATATSWELIEVKSTLSAKAEHIPDAAVQLMVIQQAGVSVDRVYIAHLDGEYVYSGGEHQGAQLLSLDDVTVDAKAYAETIEEELARMREALARDQPPDIAIGPHCHSPYECQFYAYCRAREPYWSIEELPALSAKRREQLRSAGTRSIHEITQDVPLNATQERARRSVVTGTAQSEKRLEAAVQDIVRPAHFLDFETIGPALPIYPGTRPYETVPFQWSDHVLEPSGRIKHAELLAHGSADPRTEFVDSLVAQLSNAATIVVYSGYEESCLRALQSTLPDRSEEIGELLSRRWIDLLEVVRRDYYHRDFRGSFALKSVVQAIVPGMMYEDLDIQGGMAASLAFVESISPETSARRRRKLRRDLLAYCAMDTKAMILAIDAMLGSVSWRSSTQSRLSRVLRALWPFRSDL